MTSVTCVLTVIIVAARATEELLHSDERGNVNWTLRVHDLVRSVV